MTNYTYRELLAIWDKAQYLPGKNPNILRLDTFGSPILWPDYGKEGNYGWEVDHIRPIAKGGSDAMANLQPLHWLNNRKKADK